MLWGWGLGGFVSRAHRAVGLVGGSGFWDQRVQ